MPDCLNDTFLSPKQIREVDRVAIEQFGFTGLQLMENAAGNAARRLHQIAPNGRFLFLCGRGNNGGDGFVMARHLDLAGHACEIVSVCDTDSLSPDAKANAIIARRLGISIHRYRGGDPEAWEKAIVDSHCVVVDCLLGTGATGVLRSPYDTLVEWANQSKAYRIAIDIPTGLDGDTGDAGVPCFRADRTLTFVAAKTGFQNPASVRTTGAVEVISIGVGARVLEAAGIGKTHR